VGREGGDDDTNTAPVRTGEADEEEEDEEKAMLIPSDTYDSLICGACAEKSSYIKEQKGRSGWMVIEPGEGGQGGFVIIGKEQRDETRLGEKRPLDNSSSEIVEKKSRIDDSNNESVASMGNASATEEKGETEKTSWKGKGDVFLAHGIRERLKATLDVSPVVIVACHADNDQARYSC